MPASAMQKHAEDYGYQLAFLRSDPGLYKIFQQAVNGGWDATRFVAAVKASSWYKTHGEAYRQNLALKTTDPATWSQRFASQRAIVGDVAHSIGASLTYDQFSQLTETSILMGWNDAQIREQLSRYIKAGATGGEAGQIAAQLRATAYRNGVNISPEYITNAQRRIASGLDTLESVQQQLRSYYGARVAPGFKKEVESGIDLYDVAAPYMQSMAKVLELNPSDIDLFDPTIRQALGGGAPGADGKPQEGGISLWQFEQNLRQDRRFMKTKQAQDSVMAAGNKILSDFGLIGG